MRPIVLFLTVWLPASAGAMELGGIPTPATRMQRGVTCAFAAGVAPRCSDGRLITTQSATARPCEQQQGVWTDVPANTACVSVRGLESWGANTTQISFGNNLSNAAWAARGSGMTATAAPGGGWRITRTAAGFTWRQDLTALGSSSTRTTACIVRAGTLSSLQGVLAGVGFGSGAIALPADWGVVSSTQALTTGVAPTVGLELGASGYVDVTACWHVAASTPGRPCWQASGAAPFTCSGDIHTISTSGFPTTQGKIAVAIRANEVDATVTVIVVDGRTSVAAGALLYVTSGRMVWRVDGVNIIVGPVVTAGVPHVVEIERRGTTTTMRYDGAVVGTSSSGGAWTWQTTAVLGSALGRDGTSPLQGSLSRLSWSNR